MKLGELKSLIRSRKGNPSVVALLPGGRGFEVAVQKASILEALDAAFPGGRSTETGLRLNDDGLLIGEGAPPVSDAVPKVEANDDLDSLDDLDTPAAAVDDHDEIDEL